VHDTELRGCTAVSGGCSVTAATRRLESDVEEADLRRFYEFTDFAHFIDVYIAVNSLVRTAADVEDLIVGVAHGLAGENVRYAELTVTPDSHLLMGIEPDGVAEALTNARTRARDEHAVSLVCVYDIPGELGLESGERTIDWLERFAPAGSVGFGLGGPEIGIPRPQFADVFARARALGLASVPHAGETTGPQTIRDAIDDLGAVRIGHGIAAARDPELMAVPGRARHRAGGLPDVKRLHACCHLARRASLPGAACRRCAAHPQLGRPGHVRHDAECGVPDRRHHVRAVPRRAGRPGQGRGAVFLRRRGHEVGAVGRDRRRAGGTSGRLRVAVGGWRWLTVAARNWSPTDR